MEKLKVFLSHSSSDAQFAEKLFDVLAHSDCEPWLDTKCLLPGTRWNEVIVEKLAQTDMIVLLLSASAVAKEGVLRSEIKQALRIAEQKRDDVPFLLPVRMEEFAVPAALSPFSWLDTSAVDFEERLVRALHARANLLGRVLPTYRPRAWSIPAAWIGRLRPRTTENTVKEGDVAELVSIARLLHPRHPRHADLGRIFTRWWQINPQCFEFITTTRPEGNRRIGYTCVLPLRRATYQKYASGQISEWTLGEQANPIVSAGMSRASRYLVIQSIELKEEHRRNFMGDPAWFHTLVRHLGAFNGSPVQSGAEIVADGNKIGEYLLTRAGFRRIASPESGATADPRPLFQLKFREKNPTASERRTIQKLDRYMRKYSD